MIPPLDDIETIAANSFFDFHAKGLNYICLSRSPDLTRKIYFLPKGNGEVVHPHDHRYNVKCTLLAGAVRDTRYRVDESGRDSRRLCWHSILVDGTGFRETGNLVSLVTHKIHDAVIGKPWATNHMVTHSLWPIEDSILYLEQYASDIRCTSTYVPRAARVPSIDHLYRKPTVDQVKHCLRLLADLPANSMFHRGGAVS